MTQRADFGVFIVRGQPITLAHMHIIEYSIRMCGHLFIVLGSSFAAPRWDHVPFREYIREQMILNNLTTDQRKKITFIYQKDYANMTVWADKLSQKVLNLVGDDDATIALVGHAKDKPTGYYLQQFPDWDSINLPNYGNNLSATPFRDAYISDRGWHQFEDYARPFLPTGTISVLQDFRRTKEFTSLWNEKDFMTKYLKGFYDADEVAAAKAEGRQPNCAPYPPIFYCADVCLIQGNNVLTIKRGGYPGMGLTAMPGGHCEDDTAVDAAIKELLQETKIKVPEAVLRGSIVGEKRYDDVNRSTRKRTISICQFIHLTPQVHDGQDPKKVMVLPKVRGGDDAKKAEFRPIASLRREEMFEDSWRMVDDAMSLIRK